MKLIASSRLPEPETHRYVQLIEYALSNPSFKPVDASKACSLSEKEFRFISSSIFVLSAQQSMDSDPNREYEWILKPEAYFSYLQYLEFRHSIETSKRAYWLAVAAIAVSIISVGIVLT